MHWDKTLYIAGENMGGKKKRQLAVCEIRRTLTKGQIIRHPDFGQVASKTVQSMSLLFTSFSLIVFYYGSISRSNTGLIIGTGNLRISKRVSV